MCVCGGGCLRNKPLQIKIIEQRICISSVFLDVIYVFRFCYSTIDTFDLSSSMYKCQFKGRLFPETETISALQNMSSVHIIFVSNVIPGCTTEMNATKSPVSFHNQHCFGCNDSKREVAN